MGADIWSQIFPLGRAFYERSCLIGAGNLTNSDFKSSNARGRMLNFLIDRYISSSWILLEIVNQVHSILTSSAGKKFFSVKTSAILNKFYFKTSKLLEKTRKTHLGRLQFIKLSFWLKRENWNKAERWFCSQYLLWFQVILPNCA